MTNKVLEETSNYSLQVGISLEDDKRCYLVINKETKVVEVETRILPQAYKYLEELSGGLDAMREIFKNDEELEISADNVTRIH